MRLAMRSLLMPAAGLALMVLPAAAADPSYPSGSRVGLVPAEGLVMARNFSGFEDPARGVKVLLTELPEGAFEAFEQAAKVQARIRTKTKPRAAAPESFQTATGKGYLSRETAAEGSAAARRWALIAPAAGAAVYVLMEVPATAAAAYPDQAVRRMLASVAVRDEVPPAEQLEQLPFSMQDLAGFKRMRTLIPHSAILLSDGAEDASPEDAPYMVVSAGTGGPAQADDRGRFATGLLSSIPGLRDSHVVSAEPIRIGGLGGYETRIEGIGTAKNTPMVVVQWLRFGSNGFLRIVAGASKENWPQAFPRFRAVRDGIGAR